LAVLADLSRTAGDHSSAAAHLRRAAGLLDGRDGSPAVQAALALVERVSAGVAFARGDLAAAEESACRSADRFAALAEPPSHPDRSAEWAAGLARLEEILAARGKHAEAAVVRARRVRILSRLAESGWTAGQHRPPAPAPTSPDPAGRWDRRSRSGPDLLGHGGR
jgi:hypothetical protein